MRRRWLFAAAFIPATISPIAHADSLWERRDPRQAFLFDDARARRVGDVLTIEINEATVNNETEKRALSKSNSANAGFSFSTGANFNGTGNSARQFSGNSQLQTGRTFTDQLTVCVVDVMPNGNLVVEGYRSRIINGELRELRITGTVRPIDISLQNVVQSPSVANFHISYVGKGP